MEEKREKGDLGMDRGIHLIAEKRRKLQRRWSDGLQNWSERLSPAAGKTGLAMVVMAVSSGCLWLIGNGIGGNSRGNIPRIDTVKRALLPLPPRGTADTVPTKVDSPAGFSPERRERPGGEHGGAKGPGPGPPGESGLSDGQANK